MCLSMWPDENYKTTTLEYPKYTTRTITSTSNSSTTTRTTYYSTTVESHSYPFTAIKPLTSTITTFTGTETSDISAVTSMAMLLLVYQQGDLNPSSGDSGLSQGAKIGIGVGVSLGVLAIAGIIGAALFIRRRKTKEQQMQPHIQPSMQQNTYQPADVHGNPQHNSYGYYPVNYDASQDPSKLHPNSWNGTQGTSPELPGSQSFANVNPQSPVEIGQSEGHFHELQGSAQR
jgi:hypothetical protein